MSVVRPQRSAFRRGARLGLWGVKLPAGGLTAVLVGGHFKSLRGGALRLFRVIQLAKNMFPVCGRPRLLLLIPRGCFCYPRASLMFRGGLRVPGLPGGLGALVPGGLGVQSLLLTLRLPLPPAVVAVFKHIQTLGVQRPVAAFARPALLPGHLDEAVVQGQVVTDRVLPALFVVVIEGESVHDELVDAAERGALLRCALDGHGDERDVAVGRLLRGLLAGRHEAQGGGHDPAAVASVQVDQRGGGQAQSRRCHTERRQTAVVESHDGGKAAVCPGES